MASNAENVPIWWLHHAHDRYLDVFLINGSHKCRRPYQLVASYRGIRTYCQRCYMFFNIKRSIFWPMLHMPALWFLTYRLYNPKCPHSQICGNTPKVLYSSYSCEILLYNPALGRSDLGANIPCWGCSSPGNKQLWKRTIVGTPWRSWHVIATQAVAVFLYKNQISSKNLARISKYIIWS